MNKLANEEGYHGTEPVLLIVGGDPAGIWTTGAFVFRRGETHLELHARE